jgi:3-oxoacyl-[acyl-carrier protein] reductase
MPPDAGMTPGHELAGKVALVTGGARNIGRAICRALAAGGAAVMVNARTSLAEAEETVALVGSAGGRAALRLADVTDPAAVAALVEATVRELGGLDLLVNNAAVRVETPFDALGYEEWRRVLATVLDAAFLCAKAALPHLVRSRGGGAIVNIGGLSGHQGQVGRAHVVTAKAGLAGLTRALALDLAPRAITVNCVVPGTIDTVRGLPGAPPRPAHVGVPPAGRLGEPGEVAAVVRMLCGPDARYITGQSIHVNGGAYLA